VLDRRQSAEAAVWVGRPAAAAAARPRTDVAVGVGGGGGRHHPVVGAVHPAVWHGGGRARDGREASAGVGGARSACEARQRGGGRDDGPVRRSARAKDETGKEEGGGLRWWRPPAVGAAQKRPGYRCQGGPEEHRNDGADTRSGRSGRGRRGQVHIDPSVRCCAQGVHPLPPVVVARRKKGLAPRFACASLALNLGWEPVKPRGWCTQGLAGRALKHAL